MAEINSPYQPPNPPVLRYRRSRHARMANPWPLDPMTLLSGFFKRSAMAVVEVPRESDGFAECVPRHERNSSPQSGHLVLLTAYIKMPIAFDFGLLVSSWRKHPLSANLVFSISRPWFSTSLAGPCSSQGQTLRVLRQTGLG